MFWLKKFVSFWFMPLPFCIGVLVIGLWLNRTPKRLRLGRCLCWCAVGLLVFFSNKAISNWLLRPLERVYRPIPELSSSTPLPNDLAACRYVVVLGGGNSDSAQLSALNTLSVSSLSRLTEGVRLLRALPGATLIVSGPGDAGRPTHAAVLARAAISLGIDPTRIVRIETARDTEEESVELKQRLGAEPFALVTSAWHLPRAMALMRHAGLHPLACPADFSARPSDVASWNDYSWDSDSLGRSSRAISERLGYVWSRLRGKL